MIRQIVRQDCGIQLGRDGIGRQERLDLGGKVQRAVGRQHVIERLYSETIAGEEELSSFTIPDSECEHPAQEMRRL